jgi:hypothetical protein
MFKHEITASAVLTDEQLDLVSGGSAIDQPKVTPLFDMHLPDRVHFGDPPAPTGGLVY